MLTPGGTLGGRYRLTERIASGGMGDVWKAEDTVLGREIAVKILQSALLSEPGFVERFRAEARVMATINHPGVVKVYDYGETDIDGGGQIAYLVMEYVEGEALATTLARVGRLTPARTMDLLAQAGEALQAAHEHGIVHRDVKPGNLLVRPDGRLVLTDFGIARSAMSGQLTTAGSILGTASYVSPEQATGNGNITAASDVYSLGVVGYQCLSGHRPFEGENPIQVAMKHIRDVPPPLPADVPQGAREVVDRAMAKDVAARWPSASAMADAARRVASGAPTASFGAGAAAAGGPQHTSVMPAGAPTSGPGGYAPTSGAGGYSRGAAMVPSGPPANTGYERSDEYTGAAPRRGGNGRGLRIAAIVLAVVVVLGGIGAIAYALTSGNGDNNRADGNPPTSPSAQASKSSTVDFDMNTCPGRSWDEVQQQLTKKGLNPIRKDKANFKVPAGTVISCVPARNDGQSLRAGDNVLVNVSTGGFGNGNGNGNGNGDGNGDNGGKDQMPGMHPSSPAGTTGSPSSAPTTPDSNPSPTNSDTGGGSGNNGALAGRTGDTAGAFGVGEDSP
ncbi:hypothetical protein Athai_63050 [Actinocatenispora thailandica]|uniref:non-specific serine/threonine protein kinase n=1 Tax=Actinocatenispora thailandica TaxID=227318 RepID=A0A7R7DVS8_9ACTN|nr:serine/threonine-protein kinase [Actinocatenispora thailandica]BCJ38802.1 hypothetical protein Athai_63050 [Actinocatenispora thailandica]